MSGRVELSCNVFVTLRDAKTGRIKRQMAMHNKIPTAGLDFVRELLGNVDRAPTHIAVGDDNTAPAAGDTALGNEVYRAQITAKDRDDYTAQFELYLSESEANGYTIKEAGVFNLPWSGKGRMLSRVLMAPEFAKDAETTANIQWNVTVDRA